jgi:hypothetical protein
MTSVFGAHEAETPPHTEVNYSPINELCAFDYGAITLESEGIQATRSEIEEAKCATCASILMVEDANPDASTAVLLNRTLG